MKLFLKILFLLLVIAVVACRENDERKAVDTPFTFFVYQPYSELLPALKEDVAEMERAILFQRGFKNTEILLFQSENTQKSHLMRIINSGNAICRDTLKTYDFSSIDYTYTEGLVQILQDVKSAASAPSIGMIVGAHSDGWKPVEKPRKAFGVSDSKNVNYLTNYTTLSEALSQSGLHLKFLLLDNCLSQNIECVYDLRHTADYIIASATEIMSDGLPYGKFFLSLQKGNYKAVCDADYERYYKTITPYATLSVVKTSEIDALTQIMKEINASFQFNPDRYANVQALGCSGNIEDITEDYHDLYSYVCQLCTDEKLQRRFESQLKRVVVYERHTQKYYSYLRDKKKQMEAIHDVSKRYQGDILNECCGISCSDIAQSAAYQKALKSTNWYKATH